MENKIEIKNLYFDYVNKKTSFGALENINLEIKEGEFVCILGASGCGKSTLLSILNGLNKAKSGKILIDGKEITGPGVDRAVVFQNYSLFLGKLFGRMSYLELSNLKEKKSTLKNKEMTRLIHILKQ